MYALKKVSWYTNYSSGKKPPLIENVRIKSLTCFKH